MASNGIFNKLTPRRWRVFWMDGETAVAFEKVLEYGIHGIKTIFADNNSADVGIRNYNFTTVRKTLKIFIV